ncbi:hypothetical protein HGM15179_017934 [Zosterops borbonicus]|uniref:RNase H type-1 domain-containing protein n=1 Tax=Zosterops borbonicus TaxID=364589 RepID=A0A8K1FZZ6_9PASS|nr:hypothetical protein HGM15179_017934 [Zosterops borbonicus]
MAEGNIRKAGRDRRRAKGVSKRIMSSVYCKCSGASPFSSAVWISPCQMVGLFPPLGQFQVYCASLQDYVICVLQVFWSLTLFQCSLDQSMSNGGTVSTPGAVPGVLRFPPENPDWKLFTDGSSFMRNGRWMTGYAVTTQDKVIEAKALPADMSSQKAELIALTRALDLSKGKKVNIWADSKYAFSVVHAYGAIWKERRLLNTQGNQIKHAEQILALLASIKKHTEVAIMHCKGHQKGKTAPELGNCFADKAARGIAEKGILIVIPQKEIDFSGFTQKYYQVDHKRIKFLKAEITESGWAVTPANQVVVPPLILWELAQQEHGNTHFGIENLLKHPKKVVIGKGMTDIVQSVASKCEICFKNNSDMKKRVVLGVTKAGDLPGNYRQIDFAELPHKE